MAEQVQVPPWKRPGRPLESAKILDKAETSVLTKLIVIGVPTIVVCAAVVIGQFR